MCYNRYIYFVRHAAFEIIKRKRTNVSKLIHNAYVSLMCIMSDVLNHWLRRVKIQMNEIKSFFLSQYLTNLMHKICFTISFISCLYMFRAHVLETCRGMK